MRKERSSLPLIKVADRETAKPRFVVDRRGQHEQGEWLIGQRFADKTFQSFGDQQLDIIAVHYGGGLLASFGSLGRHERGLQHRVVDYYPKGLCIGDDDVEAVATISEKPRGAVELLVDNSIKTGKTLERAVQDITANGFMPSHFLKMVDYQDDRERHAQDLLQSYGMECISLYTAAELSDCSYRSLRDRVQIAINHLGIGKYVDIPANSS